MRTRIASFLSLTGALVLVPAIALAQPSDTDRAEARRHFQAAVQHYQSREFPRALEEFQSAYRMAPHPSVRKNMAFCLVEMHRDAEALEHFEQYLAEMATVAPAERRVIDAQIRTLRARLAEVTISVRPDDLLGLVVTVDGNVVSTTRPVRVAAGAHEVRASADGYTAVTQTFTSVAGRALSLALTLERAAPSPPPLPPPPPPPVESPQTPPVEAPSTAPPGDAVVVPPTEPLVPIEEPRRGLPPGVFFAVAGVTGAAAIAWGVCGVLALSNHGDFNTTSARVSTLPANDPTVPSLTAQASQQADAARRWALWSDIAMSVTLAGVVAGTILVLNTDFNGHRMNVAASPTPGGAMFSLHSSF